METQNLLENAADKLRRKNCDMLVANSLRDKGAGFGTDTNAVTLLFADGTRETSATYAQRGCGGRNFRPPAGDAGKLNWKEKGV